MTSTKPGHGDHWRAVLGDDPGALASVLEFPADTPDAIRLQRRELTSFADLVQVTARRRLVTAYPEPRATALVNVKPRELHLWDTRVEGWLVVEHPDAGVLTLFLTDLVESATEYQRAKGEIALEVGGIAYGVEPARESDGRDRLRPAREQDARFLPDEYWFDAEVKDMVASDGAEVLDLQCQGSLVLPVANRAPTLVAPGERAQGFAWLTARWPS